jgi:hypothetical protein
MSLAATSPSVAGSEPRSCQAVPLQAQRLGEGTCAHRLPVQGRISEWLTLTGPGRPDPGARFWRANNGSELPATASLW